MKQFKGKAIYNPSGKAGEYSKWACNFYTGCPNGCTYCYCKQILRGVWTDYPRFKSCFKDEEHALKVFEKELKKNISELQEHGLFFSFTTDPMLDETFLLTMNAVNICHCNNIPVKILTKCAQWVDKFVSARGKFGQDSRINRLIAFGFTLTGHDELESGASTNAERIEAMKKLHNAGFKIFASIEPIIDFEDSYEMIIRTSDVCNLFKIGLESGKKHQRTACKLFLYNICLEFPNCKFYFKDSFLKQAGINREELPDNCVTRDFFIFKKLK